MDYSSLKKKNYLYINDILDYPLKGCLDIPQYGLFVGDKNKVIEEIEKSFNDGYGVTPVITLNEMDKQFFDKFSLFNGYYYDNKEIVDYYDDALFHIWRSYCIGPEYNLSHNNTPIENIYNIFKGIYTCICVDYCWSKRFKLIPVVDYIDDITKKTIFDSIQKGSIVAINMGREFEDINVKKHFDELLINTIENIEPPIVVFYKCQYKTNYISEKIHLLESKGIYVQFTNNEELEHKLIYEKVDSEERIDNTTYLELIEFFLNNTSKNFKFVLTKKVLENVTFKSILEEKVNPKTNIRDKSILFYSQEAKYFILDETTFPKYIYLGNELIFSLEGGLVHDK